MKRILQVFCGLFASVLTLTSCLSSSDNESTTYDDMAIKTFALGKLNRYLHTTSKAGTDSVYKSTFSATDQKMNIDQLNHRIWNADSLPVGTDVSRVVCTVTTKNNGFVYVKSLTSDTLTYFSSGSDSIDFSQPRLFRVYSSDGSGCRDYTVSLSVRNQNANIFNWVAADRADFPQSAGQAELKDGLIYIGSTRFEAYAMTKDGVLMETENGGLTWTEDQLDTDGALLPRTALAYVSWTLDAMTDYALLVGNNPAVSDKAMTVWRKLADDDGDGRWVYMPLADDNPYYLPRMEHVALACFDGYVLAFGSDHKIYRSRDQGITWRTTSMYSYPADFTGTSCQVATDEDYLWLTDPATGQTWKGWLTK